MKNPETYDKVISLTIDVQNDFLQHPEIAVPNGAAVIEPINQLNRWVRSKHGIVFFAREWEDPHAVDIEGLPVPFIRHRAGAAFPDELTVEPNDTIANNYIRSIRRDHTSWEAGLSMESRLYDPGDGRTPQVVTVDRAVEDMVLKNRQRVAVLVGGLATDTAVRSTVLSALRHRERMEERMVRDHERTYKAFRAGYGRVEVQGPVPITKPLGIFVVRNAVTAYDTRSGHAALAEMEAAGAECIDVEDLITDNVLSLRK